MYEVIFYLLIFGRVFMLHFLFLKIFHSSNLIWRSIFLRRHEPHFVMQFVNEFIPLTVVALHTHWRSKAHLHTYQYILMNRRLYCNHHNTRCRGWQPYDIRTPSYFTILPVSYSGSNTHIFSVYQWMHDGESYIHSTTCKYAIAHPCVCIYMHNKCVCTNKGIVLFCTPYTVWS